MVDALETYVGPAYIRVNRNDLAFLYPLDEPYRIGKITVLSDGQDAAIIACGVMVSKAIEASARLRTSGISTRVLNVSTIKPLAREAILEHVQGVSAIVTAEEHSRIGGLGSAVLEVLCRDRHAPVEMVAIRVSFGLSAADYTSLLVHFGLNAEAIEAAVKSLLS